MTTVGTQIVSRHIAERVRSRAELLCGLDVILADDIAALTPLAAGLSDDTVIDDGIEAPLPFTGKRFKDFLVLIQSLWTAGQNATVKAATAQAKVRSIGVIVSGLTVAASTEWTDPVAAALNGRIRPRAALLRAMRYTINDDVRYLTQLVDAAWSDDDTLDEARTDYVSPLTVGVVRVVLAFEQAILASDALSEPSALTVEAACPNPLEVL